MQHIFTAAEWEAASEDKQALVTGCTDFNLGIPTPQWDNYDADGNPIGDPARYVVNHPRVRIEDLVRATEALRVPNARVPKSTTDARGNTARPTREALRQVVEDRLRPTDADGNITRDKIAEFKAGLAEGDDIAQKLRDRT